MAAPLDITVYRGDSVDVEAKLYQDKYKRIAYDLADALVRGDIRTSLTSPVLASFDCTVLDPTTIRFGLSPEVSQTLPPGQHLYDVEVVGADGSVQTVLAGRLTVVADVTRGDA